MLELAPGDPLIKVYLKDLQHLRSQLVEHELGIKAPFQNLLDKAARRRGWTLVPELSTYSGEWPNLSGRCLGVTEFTSEKPSMVLATDIVAGQARCRCGG